MAYYVRGSSHPLDDPVRMCSVAVTGVSGTTNVFKWERRRDPSDPFVDDVGRQLEDLLVAELIRSHRLLGTIRIEPLDSTPVAADGLEFALARIGERRWCFRNVQLDAVTMCLPMGARFEDMSSLSSSIEAAVDATGLHSAVASDLADVSYSRWQKTWCIGSGVSASAVQNIRMQTIVPGAVSVRYTLAADTDIKTVLWVSKICESWPHCQKLGEYPPALAPGRKPAAICLRRADEPVMSVHLEKELVALSETIPAESALGDCWYEGTDGRIVGLHRACFLDELL